MPWNTLDVPLVNGWNCTLMPEPQYLRLMRSGRGYEEWRVRMLYPHADRYVGHATWNSRPPSNDEKAQLWENQRLRQLSDDRADFAHLFRPDWDLRTITGANALGCIKSFLNNGLQVAHWNLPNDNAGIRHMLREAVADNRLVPIIDREYRGRPRVALPDPAPQSWAANGGDGDRFTPKIYTADEFDASRRADGEVADSATSIASVGLTALISPPLNLDSAANSGVTARFAGPVHERPFEYAPYTTGDGELDAGVFLTPAEELECEMQLNADMDECASWYAMKPSSWGMCKDRAMQRYARCLKGASIG